MHVRELLELTSRLSEPLSSDEVVEVVVHRAAAAMGVPTVLVWTVDDPPSHATLVRAAGTPPDVLSRFARFPLEPRLPMGDAILRREALFFESRAEYRRRYPDSPSRGQDSGEFTDLSYACLPLVVHGLAIGGMSIVFDGAREFGEDERVFLTVLAHHVAQALERARLFEREKASRGRLERLQQLTAALSSAVTVEEIARLATRVGTDALGLSAAMLWGIDERGDLHALGVYGAPESVVEPFRLVPAGSGLPAARVARERRPIYHESAVDIVSEPPAVADTMGTGEAFRAYGALPLVRDDRVLGVLAFSAAGPRRFSPEERGFAATIAAHCADALARARLDDETRRVKRLLKSVLDRLPVGVVVAQPPDADLVFSNDAMERVWRAPGFPVSGVDRHELLRAYLPDGRRLPHEDWPAMRALRGHVIDGQELRITRMDGTEGWIQVAAAPIRGEDGAVEAAVATAFDVTAEKTARASANEASRAKDEFLAMLGHELRNPLAPILTALHLMRLRGGGKLEREQAVIERQVSHLKRLVEDLLDVARVVRGELRLERGPVEVALIVADAIEVAGPLIEERQHRLTVSVPLTGLLLDADSERIAQVVANLLSNAAKYTPSGGHITVVARAEATHVVIEVADDGSGIAPDLLPVVFDAFTQGRQGLDRKTGGLGLGLAIARQLIVAHGGTIDARSAGPGRGTTMVVRLPRASTSTSQMRSLREPVHESAHVPRRVLIVDDNPDAADMLRAVLEQAGHDVRTAPDAPSGLQLVQSFVPDIAFLDIGLPVMDGYELARLLRRTRGLASTPLVAVTGYAQQDDRRRAIANGFTEHLSKPLMPDRVLECIDRLCAAASP